jgi:hypothetical protein
MSYDPKLWGSYIAEGIQPEPQLPEGAKCDNHPARFAFNIAMYSDGSGDAYLCRECFLDGRITSKRHPFTDRRPKPTK